MRLRKYIRESKIKSWIEKQINLSYEEQEKIKNPIDDYVFRITDQKEINNLKRGFYSGSFWSSDPMEYINYLNNNSYILVAKSSGPKKYRGSTKHYHNLERREISEIENIYKVSGSRYNYRIKKIK